MHSVIDETGKMGVKLIKSHRRFKYFKRSRKLGEGPNQWHKWPVIFRGGDTGKEITLAWGGHEKMLTLPLAGESYVTLWRHLESDGRSLSSSL